MVDLPRLARSWRSSHARGRLSSHAHGRRRSHACRRRGSPVRRTVGGRGRNDRSLQLEIQLGMRKKKMHDMKNPLNSTLYDMWAINGVKSTIHSIFRPSNQKKVGATPTQPLQPNMRRVGTIPKQGSAPLRSRGSPTTQVLFHFQATW
jgi:hypothetical protein